MTHAIEKILSHKESEDGHDWKFRIEWFSGDRAEVSLSYFNDGFPNAIDLLIEYLEEKYKGTKKLLMENRDGQKVYSIMDKKETRQKVAAGCLKMVRNVFVELPDLPAAVRNVAAAPISSPVVPQNPDGVVVPLEPHQPGPLGEVEYIFQYKFMRGHDYFRVQREGSDEAVWERMSSIGHCVETRQKIVFFLLVNFPESGLVSRHDGAGNIVEYVVDPKPI